MSRTLGVAPQDLIVKDFRMLDSRETLRTTWDIEQLVLLQSVLGHVHEGHGLFRGRRFPNTTMDEIVAALRLSPSTIVRERQDLIDGITRYVQRVMEGHRPPALVTEDGVPLLGMSTLRFLQVDPADVLAGLYLGGLRDDADVRIQVEAERGVRIGCGRCYLVNRDRMEALHLTGDDLAHGEWQDSLDRFVSEGLIVGHEDRNNPTVAYQYIRLRKGVGASDDAAIVSGGFVWGLGVAVGVFLADAIDTLEKYVPDYRDQDRDLAVAIQKGFAGLRVGEEDALLLTYLASISEDAPIAVPDSSLRHLLSIDRQSDLCAAEAHLLEVVGVPTPDVGLGHERTPSHRFYAFLRERVRAVGAA